MRKIVNFLSRIFEHSICLMYLLTYFYKLLNKFRSNRLTKFFARLILSTAQRTPLPYEKIEIIKSYIKKYNNSISIFVETGTHMGETVDALKNDVDVQYIHSVEINPHYYKFCDRRFRKYHHIFIYQADSSTFLKSLLDLIIFSPCLFYLDAHCPTVSGTNIPTINELTTIFKHRVKNHVIIIDDARLLQLYQVKKLADEYNYHFKLEKDMIILEGKKSGEK